MSKFWHCLTYHLHRSDVGDDEKGKNYYQLCVQCQLYGDNEEDKQVLRTQSLNSDSKQGIMKYGHPQYSRMSYLLSPTNTGVLISP